MNTKKVNVQMLEPQPTNDLRTIDTMSSQNIAKPIVIRRFDNAFTPPFRLGKKQKRAILDANGIEVIIMPHNSESQAQMYCDYLNGA